MKRKILMISMICIMIIPILNPFLANAKVPLHNMLNSTYNIVHHTKLSSKYATNVAYGLSDEKQENGTGELKIGSTLTADVKITNFQYKINALTHEFIIKITSNKSLDGISGFSMKIKDGNLPGSNEKIIPKSDMITIDSTNHIYEIRTGDLNSQGFNKSGSYNISFEQNGEQRLIYGDDGNYYTNISINVPTIVEYNDGTTTKEYSVIGDGINKSSDQNNITSIEKATPDSVGNSLIDSALPAYGIYELESIGYENVNGVDTDSDSSTPNETDWSANDLTLVKYDHIIRPIDGKYLIGSNIDATQTSENTKTDILGGFAENGFRPIGQKIDTSSGTDSQAFIGEISGNIKDVLDSSQQNTYIQNLFINQPLLNNIGLISIASNANINNLGLIDEHVEGAMYVGGLVGGHYVDEEGKNIITNVYNIDSNEDDIPDIIGDTYVGGIVGNSYADTISSDERFLGSIDGWDDNGMEQPLANQPDRDGYKTFNTSDISGTENVGGIAGESFMSSINNVYNKGLISSTANSGGIVGLVSGEDTIFNAYNTGSILGETNLGGIVGYVAGDLVNISHVYNIGEINNADSSNVGGIIGNVVYSTTVNVSNVYNTGKITGISYIGGLIGYGNVTLSDSYNLGPIEVLKESSTGVEVDYPYVGGIIGSFGTYTTPATLTNVLSAGSVTYALDDTKTQTYVGDVTGQPSTTNDNSGLSYIQGTFDNVYALDEIKLPLTADIDYPNKNLVIISEVSLTSFWSDTLLFSTDNWNLSTIPAPSPDSDPNDESSGDATENIIESLGFYAQLKESRTDDVVVEIPEQKSTPFYRDIVNYKINAITLDITIKYNDTYEYGNNLEFSLEKNGKLRNKPITCNPIENDLDDTFTFSGETCEIEQDQDYDIIINGLLNGEIKLSIHTPKQVKQDYDLNQDGTITIDEENIPFAIIGDGVNRDTFVDVQGNTSYENTTFTMPSTVAKSTIDESNPAYGIYELESICYEDAQSTKNSSSHYVWENDKWTDKDFTLTKYDHIQRPCDGNYIIDGDVDATVVNEDIDNFKPNEEGGFSSYENSTSTNLINTGFNPIGTPNLENNISVQPISFTGSIIGGNFNIFGVYKDDVIKILNLFQNVNIAYSGLISKAEGALIKDISLDGGKISNSYSSSNVGPILGYGIETIIKNTSTNIEIDITKATRIGGLVGWLSNSVVENSYVIANNYTVSESSFEGGLTGYMTDSTINNSYVVGDISVTSKSTNVGGISGFGSESAVTNAYYSGNLVANNCTTAGGIISFSNDDTITNSYSTGKISGYSNLGGLVGSSNSTTISNSYSTANLYAETYEVGGIVGSTSTDSSYFINSYAYEGQEIYLGPEMIHQAIGTDNTTDAYEYFKTYDEIITEEFYTNDLGWDMSIWEFPDNDPIYHPIFVNPSEFLDFINSQPKVLKTDIPEVLADQEIGNFKIEANKLNVTLLLNPSLFKTSMTKSTKIKVEVIPDAGYSGGNTNYEKIYLNSNGGNNTLFLSATTYDIRPDSIYTIRITNNSGVEDSIRIHTPYKNTNNYIPLGDETTISETDVDGRFKANSIDVTTDDYEIAELESICYDQTMDNNYRWTNKDLTLVKYDHVIRECDANYVIHDDIDMTPVNQTGELIADEMGGYATDSDEDGIADANDGFNSITYFTGILDGNNMTIYNYYNTSTVEHNTGGLINELSTYGNQAIVKNLNMDTAYISNYNYDELGTLANSMTGATVKNVNILNTHIEGDEMGGLAAYADESTIDNVHVINPQITGYTPLGPTNSGGLLAHGVNTAISNSSVTNLQMNDLHRFSGGLIGNLSYSSINNCYVTGDIELNPTGNFIHSIGGLSGSTFATTIDNSYADVNINYEEGLDGVTSYINYVGGLVGDNSARVTNSYALGSINFSTLSPDPLLFDGVGGLTGISSSTVTDSYSNVDINYPENSEAYNSDGQISIGGLIGRNKTTTIVNSYINENQKLNGELVPANKIVGNDTSTDLNVTSYDVYKIGIDALTDSTWYENVDEIPGAGVNWDDTNWEAPHIEGTMICYPFLYKSGITPVEYVNNQTCIEIISGFKLNNNINSRDTFDVSQSQKDASNKSQTSPNQDETNNELILNDETNIIYPSLKYYMDNNNYDYNLFLQNVQNLNNPNIYTFLNQLETQLEINPNYIDENEETIKAFINKFSR